MPFATESTGPAPEITVDASGHDVVSKTIQSLDPHGKIITEQELAAIKDPPPVQTEQEKKEEVEKPATEAEARKLFLQAQKAERRAAEMEKKAKSNLAKAEAFDAAKELAISGKDPTAILKAAGIEPIKFYRDMTTFALKGEEKPEDPVQRELRLLKEQNEKYAKELEVEVKSRQDEKDLAAHNAVITTKVIPLLTNNPEKYEALLAEYGQNAAAQVYTEVWNHYQKTGETVPFEQAADVLEDYWSKQIESGINAASKLKKFSNRFAQAAAQIETKAEQLETPRRSAFTLSNKQTISPGSSNVAYNRYIDKEARAAEILKKFQ